MTAVFGVPSGRNTPVRFMMSSARTFLSFLLVSARNSFVSRIGTGICIYATHFEVIPANRRSYNISVNNFGAAVLYI